MKPNPTKQVVYNPTNESIFFVDEAGHITHGFTGTQATQEMAQAVLNGIDVVFAEKQEEFQAFDEQLILIRQFYAILSKKGLVSLKEDILAAEGVESTKDLTVEQLKALVKRFNTTDVPPIVRRHRSTVLHLLQKMGITGSSADGWDKVNNFLKNPRISGKNLYEMSLKELEDCAMRLRAIQSKSKNQ